MFAIVVSPVSAVAAPSEDPPQQATTSSKSTAPHPFSMLKFLVAANAESAAGQSDADIWRRIVSFALEQHSLTVTSGPTITRADGRIRIQLSVEVEMTEGEAQENVGKQSIDVSRPIS
jgi:hypothetical protein